MKIVLVSKCSLDIEYVEFKCQFWYLPQRASLACVRSQITEVGYILQLVFYSTV